MPDCIPLETVTLAASTCSERSWFRPTDSPVTVKIPRPLLLFPCGHTLKNNSSLLALKNLSYPWNPFIAQMVLYSRKLFFRLFRYSLHCIIFFKGIVCQKINICWKCARRQAIQDVDEFVSSLDLEKCSVASLPHQFQMGAIRMRVQTVDKNITIIHK